MEASELTRFNDLIKNQGQEPTKRRKKGEPSPRDPPAPAHACVSLHRSSGSVHVPISANVLTHVGISRLHLGEKKLNKDGSEKAPRKPTAYNHWMQEKVPPCICCAPCFCSQSCSGH